MTKSSPKTEWTEGRINAFITSALRAGMRRWPPKWQALEDACVGSLENAKTGRKAKHYKCAMCGGLFVAKDVEVDHITPVVDPVVGFVSWDEFIKRLYCSSDNLQILDKKCHKLKTASERTARKTSQKPPLSTSSEPLKSKSKKTPSKSGSSSRATRKRT